MEQSERKAAEEAGKSAEMTLQMLNVEIADKDQLINKKDGKILLNVWYF